MISEKSGNFSAGTLASIPTFDILEWYGRGNENKITKGETKCRKSPIKASIEQLLLNAMHTEAFAGCMYRKNANSVRRGTAASNRHENGIFRVPVK